MEGSPHGNQVQVPSEPAVKRFRILWRVFLIFNFGLGAYMFAQGGKKERAKQKAIEEPHPSPPTAVTAPAQEEPIIITPPVERPVPVRKPVPEDQQREIFKWILEEKRKAKPQNRQEKKRIDEEKAILKEFIRAESLPKI
ncbi:uncharacterized protein LOC131004904 isoform X2 [Salvia miltiorrhiza]|uniref:uncharacterized protein LOC130986447 isoform X2 n=1 Tax=Salvia miltiorrhiza TaxID=226208 RepID=UPI0025ABEB54|nr:uncharacterized protein LOC130986447 isoform X2 [Salvia miltiorrhiza]XP_057787654.1 uncharacterized protein LOC131004904 isoform X2 [Salvia miltiorrhiza]